MLVYYLEYLDELIWPLGLNVVYTGDGYGRKGSCATSLGLGECIEPYLARNWSGIYWNWGLHDVKPVHGDIVDPKDYRARLQEAADRIGRALAPGVGRQIFATSVPVGHSYASRRNADIARLNAVARAAFSNRSDVAVVDLYAAYVRACGKACYPDACDCDELQYDQLHPTDAGVRLCGVLAARAILEEVATPLRGGRGIRHRAPVYPDTRQVSL